MRNGKTIGSNQKAEIYLNETELKKAGAKFVKQIMFCELFSTDNMALRVKGGVRVRSRIPGKADQHLCLRGKWVSLEGKMPGKTLDPDQEKYRDKVLAAQGIFIEYHSVWELEKKMREHGLISGKLKNS